MKCPKCGKQMILQGMTDTANYIKRKLSCTPCNYNAVSYEFFAEDIPDGFVASGTRVLIGDNRRDIVPGVYAGTIDNLYPHLAIDNDGQLQGKRIIPVQWEIKEL